MDLDEPLNLLRSVVSPSLPPDTTNPIVSAAISPTVLKAQANPFEFIKTFTFFPPSKTKQKGSLWSVFKNKFFFFLFKIGKLYGKSQQSKQVLKNRQNDSFSTSCSVFYVWARTGTEKRKRQCDRDVDKILTQKEIFKASDIFNGTRLY